MGQRRRKRKRWATQKRSGEMDRDEKKRGLQIDRERKKNIEGGRETGEKNIYTEGVKVGEQEV